MIKYLFIFRKWYVIHNYHLLYQVECFIGVSATDKNGNLTCEIIHGDLTCEINYRFLLIVVKLVNTYSIL